MPRSSDPPVITTPSECFPQVDAVVADGVDQLWFLTSQPSEIGVHPADLLGA
jgi:hypothetical protein